MPHCLHHDVERRHERLGHHRKVSVPHVHAIRVSVSIPDVGETFVSFNQPALIITAAKSRLDPELPEVLFDVLLQSRLTPDLHTLSHARSLRQIFGADRKQHLSHVSPQFRMESFPPVVVEPRFAVAGNF